tara:strand:+ start:100 stop:978 length:879 start_codon:yes stop_codon:yes gene_type:complete
MSDLNIAVLMWFDDVYGARFANASYAINKIYCNKHGYDLIHCNKPSGNDFRNEPPWEKVPMLLGHITDYDYIVWIDADAHFYTDKGRIEDIIKLYSDKDLILSQDHPSDSHKKIEGLRGLAKWSDSHRIDENNDIVDITYARNTFTPVDSKISWSVLTEKDQASVKQLQKQYPDIDFINYIEHEINTGIMIIKNTPRCINILQKWAARGIQIDKHTSLIRAWDQGALREMWRSNVERLKDNSVVLPYGILQHFNLPTDPDTSPYVRHFCGRGKDFCEERIPGYLKNLNTTVL